MNYEMIVKPNHWDRTFTIRLKYPKGGIEKYRTDRVTEEEFETMLNYTPFNWEQYLDMADNYKRI